MTPTGLWRFLPERLRDGELVGVVGPNLKVSGRPRNRLGGLALKGPTEGFTYPWYRWDAWPEFPRGAFTIDLVAWTSSVREPQSLVSCLFAGDDGPRGWSLTIEEGRTRFRIATERGEISLYAPAPPHDRFVAFTAAYDGSQINLSLDDAPVASADAPLGPLQFPGRTPFAVGGAWQGDRTLGLGEGILRSVALFSGTLPGDRTAILRAARQPVLAPLPCLEPDALAFTIAPTIQRATDDAATIVWETNALSCGEVRFRSGDGPERVQLSRKGPRRIHKVRLASLRPGEPVTFAVHAFRPNRDDTCSPEATFRPLPRAGEPLRFVVIADTQDRPAVNGALAHRMRAHAPALGLVVGDLVTAGWEKDLWVGAFFGSMHSLWADVPLFPVLGNHDRNAQLYYDLMALPRPRYRYTFRAGDAQFFLVDTEFEVGPYTPQFRWLENALARSTARWKIVAHHYPPYSSDLDDYGDALGDVTARQLVPLYDRFGVDLVVSGHIHSYERTHPLRGGKVSDSGTTYVVLGGGGGDLEQFLPEPPAFSAARKSDHHYAVLDLSADTLALRAYDRDNVLFDTVVLRK